MKKSFAAISLLATLGLAPFSVGQDVPTQHAVTQTLHIGGPGRWDYLTVDPADHLLYITRSTHVNVVDPSSGKVVADIQGGTGLHGTAVVPSVGRGFVSDGKAGQIIVFDLKTRAVLGKIAAADDADGIIYDEGSDRVLTSCGDAASLLILDPHADVATAKVQSVDLGGKPEFLAADGKGRAFVCINDKNEIAVVDIQTAKVTGRWGCGHGTEPTGLAIDAKNGRLYIGCRNKMMVVMSTEGGKVLAELPVGAGNDACAFDSTTGEAFASCGDGTMTVIRENPSGAFTATQTIKTQQGTRTVALDPSTHTLYLPTAEFEAPTEKGKRPAAKPDSFRVLIVH